MNKKVNRKTKLALKKQELLKARNEILRQKVVNKQTRTESINVLEARNPKALMNFSFYDTSLDSVFGKSVR